MTSDLGAELRAMLADRDPGPAPAALRARAEAIPVRLRPSSPRLWAGLGAVAALGLMVVMAILLGLPRLALDRGTAPSLSQARCPPSRRLPVRVRATAHRMRS
jgi:anti-sigma factor RsiW